MDEERGALERYAAKRSASVTPEPGPGEAAPAHGPLLFVVQKHAARNLHYDVRIELDGVLISWAVPKGPSALLGEKRLAMKVEDHPLEYRHFEGQIPRGQYGGGEMIVWDTGTYLPDDDGTPVQLDRDEALRRVRKGLEAGKLSLWFRGERLKGSYAFVKIKTGDNQWLLLKHRDPYAQEAEDTLLAPETSVLSGRTLEDVRGGRKAAEEPPVHPASQVQDARRAPLPEAFKPMLASSCDKPFDDDRWTFELKLDGIRIVAILDRGRVKLLSRGEKDVTRKFPAVVAQLAALDVRQAVLDGEVIALDERKKVNFQTLMKRFLLDRDLDIRNASRKVPASYCVFDVLHLDGWDLTRTPLSARKELLETIALPGAHLQRVDHYPGEGKVLFEAARQMELEGVVAKRLDSRYAPGARSDQWLKCKTFLSDDFFIGGFTQGEGARKETFGSLCVGQFQEGKLVSFGNVGSGFDDTMLATFRKQLDEISQTQCPFDPPPPAPPGTTWVAPVLACEVKYANLTDEGNLRAPVFLRMRPDLAPPGPDPAEAAPVTPPADPAEALAIEANLDAVLDQIDGATKGFELQVQGAIVAVTNPDKPLWPGLGDEAPVTKRDYLRYLAQVSPYLLPNMRDRPITLTRYPHGIEGEHFYQKHYEHDLPPFVETFRIFSGHNQKATEYMVCNNLPTLLWLGQIADLELHTWYSRISPEPDARDKGLDFWSSEEALEASVLNYPDFMVIDLDPYIYSGNEKKGAEPELDRAAFAKTVKIALALRPILEALGLKGFPKLSGKTGIHIFVPIVRNLEYDAVRAFAATLGHHLLRQRPKDVTMEWSVPKRTGKIFYDHNQNVRGKTLASIYSPRPAPGAPVSVPVEWDELESVYPTDFTVRTVMARLEVKGDLWKGILEEKVDVAKLLG
ncbi:MAG: ATP-dependent DNA ligase [Chthonomonadaceae bacterium]|nr:ATP-dependent DNA ligase [Chthonomonadaceae bacterium]